MANFIEDGTTDQGSPTDADVYPKVTHALQPSIPNTQKIRAADFNILDKAMQDTRTWFHAQKYGIFAPNADPAPSGFGGSGQNPYMFSDASRIPQWKASGTITNFVIGTQNINTTSGHLTGGGALTGNLTLGLANTGPGAGTYGGSGNVVESVTLDNQGRVTNYTTTPSGSLPDVGPGAGTYGNSNKNYLRSHTLDAKGRTTALTFKSLPFYDVVADFGAVGDGTTDDSTAFANAIAALGTVNTPLGSTLYVPAATYKLNSDLIINRNMVLRGAAGTGRYGATILKFAEGHGIKCTAATGGGGTATGQHCTIEHFQIQSAGDGTGTTRFRLVNTGGMVRSSNVVTVTTVSAHGLSNGDQVTLDGSETNFVNGTKTVMVTGANTFTYTETGPDATSLRDHTFVYTTRAAVHGIDSRTIVNVNHCYIEGFGGHGINIQASSNVDTSDPIYGNANGWSISHCMFENNVLFGLNLASDDSQAGTALNCIFLSNGLGGVYDSSFLGNTYIGCEAEASLDESNPGAAYWVDNNVTFSTFIGCYGESDLRRGTLPDSAIAIGGDNAAQFGITSGQFPGWDTATSTGMRILNSAKIGFFTVYTTEGPTYRRIQLGNKSQTYVMAYETFEDSEAIELKYNNYLTGFWSWERQSRVIYAFTDSNAVMSRGGDNAGWLVFPNGYLWKGSGIGAFLNQQVATAAPSSGTWIQGDFTWDGNATIGGTGNNQYARLGWLCTSGGAPGTWLELRTLTSNSSPVYNPNSTNSADLGTTSIQWRNTYSRRYAATGTALTTGDIAITDFGTGGSSSLESGSDDMHGAITITAGTGASANPTFIITFKDGNWGNAPKGICVLENTSDTGLTAAYFVEMSASAVGSITFKLNGYTPVSTKTYKFRWQVLGLT